MAVVDADITGKSADGDSALPTNIHVGEVGGSVQLQRRAVFGFRLRLAASCPVAFGIFHLMMYDIDSQSYSLTGRIEHASVA